MPLFGRHRDPSGPPVPDPIPGLAGVMAPMGFAPVTGQIFDGHLEQSIHDATPTMYGVGRDTYSQKVTRIGATTFDDAFRGSVEGRTVTVANAWTNIGPEVRFSKGYMRGVAVCAVELPSILFFAYVQSRQFAQLTQFPAVPTGDAAFADVRTPQEAQERFADLDQASQMQVMTMFMKVKDQERGT